MCIAAVPTPATEAGRKGAAAGKLAADAFAANVLPIVRQMQAAGLTTLAQIADALKARGIRTARGGSWHPSTVQNLLARLASLPLSDSPAPLVSTCQQKHEIACSPHGSCVTRGPVQCLICGPSAQDGLFKEERYE